MSKEKRTFDSIKDPEGDEIKTIFDGMEDFEAGEVIGMDFLNEVIDNQPLTYSEEDFEAAKKLIKD